MDRKREKHISAPRLSERAPRRLHRALAMAAGFALLLALPASGRREARAEAPTGAAETPRPAVSTPAPTPEAAGETPDAFRILLIGHDRRQEEELARSDAMVLCEVDPAAQKIRLVSFMRDLYVEIPGCGGNRLNAAYAFGGAPLLLETIRQNFGVEIDHWAEADFQSFTALIDTMGGVRVALRSDEAKLVGCGDEEKEYLLDGTQALEYVRIRRLDSDFARTERQRRVLSALWRRAGELRLSELAGLAGQVLGLVETDLTAPEALKLAAAVVPHARGYTLSAQRVPQDGCCEDAVIDGMAVLLPKGELCREALEDFLRE